MEDDTLPFVDPAEHVADLGAELALEGRPLRRYDGDVQPALAQAAGSLDRDEPSTDHDSAGEISLLAPQKKVVVRY